MDERATEKRTRFTDYEDVLLISRAKVYEQEVRYKHKHERCIFWETLREEFRRKLLRQHGPAQLRSEQESPFYKRWLHIRTSYRKVKNRVTRDGEHLPTTERELNANIEQARMELKSQPKGMLGHTLGFLHFKQIFMEIDGWSAIDCGHDGSEDDDNGCDADNHMLADQRGIEGERQLEGTDDAIDADAQGGRTRSQSEDTVLTDAQPNPMYETNLNTDTREGPDRIRTSEGGDARSEQLASQVDRLVRELQAVVDVELRKITPRSSAVEIAVHLTRTAEQIHLCPQDSPLLEGLHAAYKVLQNELYAAAAAVDPDHATSPDLAPSSEPSPKRRREQPQDDDGDSQHTQEQL